MSKIYVKKHKKKGEKVEDFFNRLYNDSYGSIETFHNYECNITQCNIGKNRSFSDIHKLIKTYYPKITHKKLIKIIYDYCITNGNTLIYCDNINKIVLTGGGFWINNDYILNRTFFDYNRIISKNRTDYTDRFTIYYLYKKLGYSIKEIKNEIKTIQI